MEQVYIVNVIKPYVVSEYIVWADNGDEAILAVMDLRILRDNIDRPAYLEYSYRKLSKEDWLIEHDVNARTIRIYYQSTNYQRGLLFNLVKNQPLYFSGCKTINNYR